MYFSFYWILCLPRMCYIVPRGVIFLQGVPRFSGGAPRFPWGRCRVFPKSVTFSRRALHSPEGHYFPLKGVTFSRMQPLPYAVCWKTHEQGSTVEVAFEPMLCACLCFFIHSITHALNSSIPAQLCLLNFLLPYGDIIAVRPGSTRTLVS